MGARIWASAAAALAGMAMVNHRAAREAERKHPPQGRFVEVEGVRLHVLEAGEGPTIVLIHGALVSAADWAASGVMDDLARRGRVLAFDRPGYGFSERPPSRTWSPHAQARVIAAAMDALGAWPAVAIGHSLGTQVALELARERPDQVKALALMSGYYRPTLRPLDQALSIGPAAPLIGPALASSLAPTLAGLGWRLIERLLFAPAPTPDTFKRSPLDLSLRPKQLRATAQDMTGAIPAAARLWSATDAIRQPVLLLAGAQDRFVSAKAQTVRLAQRLPRRARLVLIPDHGHMTHHTAPGPVRDALNAFLDEVSEAEAEAPAPPLKRVRAATG